MFEVTVDRQFDFLSPEYARLFEASRATAFQHPIWLQKLYGDLIDRVDARPLIIVVRAAADKRLEMVLPLVRLQHGLFKVVEFADLRVSDYSVPVCTDDTFYRICADAGTCELIRQALVPFDLLRIKKLPADSLALERLLPGTSRAPMDMSAHAVALQAPFPVWRANCVNASFRKELDKKMRQLRRKGDLRFECAQDPAAIRATLESMREYRRPRFQDRGDGDGDLLQKSAYFDFYLNVALEGRNGFTRTYSLSLDGRPIAGVLGLSHRKQCLVVLGGFDQVGFKNQSIGSLMFEEVARDCIERGDAVLDFTIGDEPYKRLYGAVPSDMWMVTCAGSRLGSLGGFVVDKVPWMKDVARRILQKQRAA